MVMAVGLSQYNVALMHVVNHAFLREPIHFIVNTPICWNLSKKNKDTLKYSKVIIL